MPADVVPSDCLAAHLARRLPGATSLALGFQALGRPSHGTATTMVENAHRGGAVRRGGRIVTVPAGWRRRTIDFGRGPRQAPLHPAAPARERLRAPRARHDRRLPPHRARPGRADLPALPRDLGAASRECRGAGLFPGLTDEQVRLAREHEGERIPLSREVTITLFAMPRGACDEIARDLQALATDYAPARFRLVTPKNREACIELGVTGFPTLLVTWRGAPVRVLDGYHTNEQVRAALADLFQPTE